LLAVNTWTNKIFVRPVKNTRQSELIAALGAMTKVSLFFNPIFLALKKKTFFTFF